VAGCGVDVDEPAGKGDDVHALREYLTGAGFRELSFAWELSGCCGATMFPALGANRVQSAKKPQKAATSIVEIIFSCDANWCGRNSVAVSRRTCRAA
jgi:hypothetical protein